MTATHLSSHGVPYRVVRGLDGAEELLRLRHTAHCFRAYEVNPSIGCDLLCRYCSMYSQEEQERHVPMTIYADYPAYLDAFIAGHPNPEDLLFYFSARADAFSPAYVESGITAAILEVLQRTGVRFFVLTKGSTVTDEVFDLLVRSRERSQVIFSCGLPSEELELLLEPGAPPSRQRLMLARRCIEAGIPVTGIVAPYLPLGNTEEYARHVFSMLKAAGINHLGIQVLKVSADCLDRMCDLLREHKGRLAELFEMKHKMQLGWRLPGGKRIDRYYTSVDFLAKELLALRDIAATMGMTVSTCTEICKLIDNPGFNTPAVKAGYSCAGVSTRLLRPARQSGASRRHAGQADALRHIHRPEGDSPERAR